MPTEGSSDINQPKSLLRACLDTFAVQTDYSVSSIMRVEQLRSLPYHLLIEVLEMMAGHENLKNIVVEQFSDLSLFYRLLTFNHMRHKLYRIMSDLKPAQKSLPLNLQNNYIQRFEIKKKARNERKVSKLSKLCRDKLMKKLAFKLENGLDVNESFEDIDSDVDLFTSDDDQSDDGLAAENYDPETYIPPINCGILLGTFMSEVGWLVNSIEVLKCLEVRLKRCNLNVERIDCLQRILHAQSAYCDFNGAKQTAMLIEKLFRYVVMPSYLKAITYTQISAMYFARNDYNSSYEWSFKGLKEMSDYAPEGIAIDVLRQTAKACVVKREYARANLLICQAMARARAAFGTNHQKYADTLLDYGYFLLNVDSIFHSVRVYKQALEIRRNIFGNHNFHVAVAHEDLSYAYYVHEYSTGDFSFAQDHVERAVSIMKDIVPSNHLLLASAKRVKALLLEEIALDKMADGLNEDGLLKQSESLHQFALQLSLEVFGEMNVQTAKHYGNLGRLYQTMNRFDEAVCMHEKAIKIKTELLGPFDYEVGLSIGHLASLYNYQMKRYREAEELYMRSIDISLRLFGHSYSGLEYDYLGLCHVYETLHEFSKYVYYANILEAWQRLRNQNQTLNKRYPQYTNILPMAAVAHHFCNPNSIANFINKGATEN